MEIAVVRYQVQEQDRTMYHIEPHISTVADLRMMIQRSLNLDSDFSLGFVHHNGQALADLGLREGSVIYISDWAGDLAFALEDLEAPAEDVVVAPGDSTESGDLLGPGRRNLGKEVEVVALGDSTESGDLLGAAPADVVAPFDSTGNLCGNASQIPSQGGEGPSLIPAGNDKVDIKWFEPSDIGRVDWSNAFKKFLNRKIKVRVICGHQPPVVAANNFNIISGDAPPPSCWVVGGDCFVDACATLNDLRADLRAAAQFSLPPRFSFWTLSHRRLNEKLMLSENGIRDGDTVILCRQGDWHLKVSLPNEVLEVDFNPLSNVSELKRILCLSDSATGRWLSALQSFSITFSGKILDESSSLEAQILDEMLEAQILDGMDDLSLTFEILS